MNKKILSIIVATALILLCVFFLKTTLYYSSTEINYSVLNDESSIWVAEDQTLKVDEKIYSYSDFPNNNDIDTSRECIDSFQLNDNYLIVSYKNYDMHHNHLSQHIEDQLIYLNDNQVTATVIYKSEKKVRILYGDETYCIVYNANANAYQYIDLKTQTVIYEYAAQLKLKNREYYFTYDSKNKEILKTGDGCVSSIPLR